MENTTHVNATLFLTTLRTGQVDITYHEHTPTGRCKRAGHRYWIAPSMPAALAFVNPQANVRVVVRAEN